MTSDSKYYTHAMWKIKPGNESKFRQTWLKLGQRFSNLKNTPIYGKLIKSTQEPTLFYSFGVWNRLEDIEMMRDNKESMEIIKELTNLCIETTPPGAYTVIEEVHIEQKEYAGKTR